MIVVVIVAIIVSIAYPSYQEQIRKTRRSDAQSALMNAAAILERNYTQFGHYGAGAAIPATSSENFYTLTAVGTIANSQIFTITAAPVAGTDQANDRCGNLTINQTQQRGAVNGNGLGEAECW